MENKIVKKFIELAKIDSPSGREEMIRKYLVNWLKKNNFRLKKDKIGNLYAKKGTSGKPILFCAHMDTVEPGKNIQPLIKKKYITSNGKTVLGSDNKAFIASLLLALEAYKGNRKIEVIFSVKEETGGGIEFFPINWIEAKTGFIFDNANPIGGIILRSPYIINFHIIIKGKAAHSSNPDKGLNSLSIAVQIINKLNLGFLDHANTTINIGIFESGTGINTIPAMTKFSGEIRSYSKKTFNEHRKAIKSLINSQSKKTKASINFEEDGYCPGYNFERNDQLIFDIKKLMLKKKIKPKFHLYSGISDANILNSKGVKTIVLSDGVIDPHTTKESISIDSLKNMEAIISAIIYSND